MPIARKATRVVHGDDLLYEFFQHALSDDSGAFEQVPRLLIETMGVWLPLDVYERWPVLLPFVLRDPDCRPKPSIGRLDAWGAPNADGYLRDDNSLVKGLPRSLEIRGPRGRRISGSRMGTEFVAAHIWRVVSGTQVLASRIPRLNTFVPNLVWLPGQIAKLTDREGSVVQRTAQSMAYEIYRDAPVAPHLRDLVEECWARLPKPDVTSAPLDVNSLNFFVSRPAFFALRRKRLDEVLRALDDVISGRPLEDKVVTTRYTEGLPSVSPTALRDLRDELLRYRSEDDVAR